MVLHANVVTGQEYLRMRPFDRDTIYKIAHLRRRLGASLEVDLRASAATGSTIIHQREV